MSECVIPRQAPVLASIAGVPAISSLLGGGHYHSTITMESSYTDPPQSNEDALSLDIHVLTILLQRNYYQQHRCLYYKRLSMVLQSLRRCCPSLDEFNEWTRELRRLSKLLIEKYGDIDPSLSRKKRAKREEHWTIDRCDGDTFNGDPSDTNDHEASHLPSTIQKLRTSTTESIPQIISRILHATSAVVHELSRGYFVPFLTVALACLGRIHTLLLRMGREAVTSLREIIPTLRKLIVDHRREMISDKLNWEEVNGQVTPLFLSSTSTTTEANEWSALMGQFLEVHADDLNNRVDKFVKDSRWTNAMKQLRLENGIGGTEEAASESNVATDEYRPRESMDFENVSSVVEAKYSVFNHTQSNVGIDISDLGELIDTKSITDDAVATKRKQPSVEVDDNLARIKQLQKDKCKLVDQSKTESTTKRKKKKRTKSSKDCNIESIFGGTASHIEKDLTTTADVIGEPESSYKRPNGTEGDGHGNEVEEQTKGGSRDRKSTKKDKKKRKSKTKKSKSVIDDIFG